MIELEALSKRFGAIEAVRGVSLRAPDGRITGLLGPNGAGKSTTLRLLYGVLRPDAGRALVDGIDIAREPVAALGRLGVLPHNAGIYPQLTARENIRYFGRLQGLGGAPLERRIGELIELLEMRDFAERRAKGFSQGQRLRVALARALVHAPKNLVLDEPTNGLDVLATRSLRELILRLKDAGHAVLFSSHVMQEVTALCDEIVIIGAGRVVATGTPAELNRTVASGSLEDAFVAALERGPEALMRAFLTVLLKELLENARDRRTLLSALLVGPIGAPLLFSLMISVTLHRNLDNAEKPLALAVAGGEHAPNLVGFLKAHDVAVSEFAGDAAAATRAVRAHELKLVLLIPPGFGARLGAGRPAPVELYLDSSDTSAGADRNRAAALIAHYSTEIARWRLEARGLAPTLMQAIALDEVDVSTAAGRAVALLGMLSYFFVFAALMGGIYVAIDATAGERERGSLEPLLTLPVRRSALVLGKILAASAWMLVSLALTVTAFAISLRFVRLEALGMSTNVGPRVVLTIIALMLPFLLMGAALMTLVASFTRSYREAQSWLTFVLLVPTVPIMYAAVSQLQSRLALMWIPSLSQHLLISSLLKAEPLAPLDVLVSAGATLVLGAAICAVAIRLYRREQILG